jgi:hypothetical protein
MRERRERIGLAVLLLALLGLALFVRPAARGTDSRDRRVATYRLGAFGGRALYMLVEELGLPAERTLRPWTDSIGAGPRVVLAPSERPTPREVDALMAWLEVGGTLIYGRGDLADPLLGRLGLRVRRLRPDSLGPLATVRWAGETAHAAAHSLSAGVDSVPGFARAFVDSAQALRSAGAEVVLRTAGGAPTVVTFPVGAGRVVAWSDATVLGNRPLRDSGAALVFVRAVAPALTRGAAVRFDEFHHGYREANPARALGRFFVHTGMGRALLQAGLACLALLLLAGHRLGMPLREAGGHRRSPLEHMEAVAGAYRRADARRTTRRLLVAGLERRLGRKVLEGPEERPAAALATTPAGRQLQQEWERGPGADLVALAAAVDDFVREMRRWR